VEAAFLQALHADPNDETTWLALADWLEDDGQPQRAELVRLVRRLRALPVMKRRKERARLEDWVAELLNAGVRPVVPEVVNSIGMRLALIPPGRFRMGSPVSEAGRKEDEIPLHEVEITRPFYLGVFPVTQRQWQAVMGSNPSYFCTTGGGKDEVKGLDTEDFPVEQVSWDDAQAFLEKLTRLPEEVKSRWRYRLPTEAEWEYACRAGTSTPFHLGKSLSSWQANFNGDYPYGDAEKGPSLGRTCAVGSYRPNVFGLFDLHGNVWEWCSDWYDEDSYGTSPPRDPPGSSSGSVRVLRGGGWGSIGQNGRAASRYGGPPSYRFYNLGFRVAAVPQG
jgi:uncharacterized protein (TIGR02996 family)